MSPRIIIKKVACYFSTYFFWSTGSRFSTPKKQVEKMMTCILKNKPMVNGFGHFFKLYHATRISFFGGSVSILINFDFEILC